MGRKIKDEIAARFIRAYRLLYLDGIVRNKSEFCTRVHLFPQNFSVIEQGRMTCSLDNIYYLSTVFGVSLDWIIKGEGDFIIKKD